MSEHALFMYFPIPARAPAGNAPWPWSRDGDGWITLQRQLEDSAARCDAAAEAAELDFAGDEAVFCLYGADVDQLVRAARQVLGRLDEAPRPRLIVRRGILR